MRNIGLSMLAKVWRATMDAIDYANDEEVGKGIFSPEVAISRAVEKYLEVGEGLLPEEALEEKLYIRARAERVFTSKFEEGLRKHLGFDEYINQDKEIPHEVNDIYILAQVEGPKAAARAFDRHLEDEIEKRQLMDIEQPGELPEELKGLDIEPEEEQIEGLPNNHEGVEIEEVQIEGMPQQEGFVARLEAERAEGQQQTRR